MKSNNLKSQVIYFFFLIKLLIALGTGFVPLSYIRLWLGMIEITQIKKKKLIMIEIIKFKFSIPILFKFTHIDRNYRNKKKNIYIYIL